LALVHRAVQVKSDGSGVETDGVKMSINPFDEIALEEALRIKERGEASEVIAVSIGSSEAQQQLRTGLAMGADRAILVQLGAGVQAHRRSGKRRTRAARKTGNRWGQ
jgi:electron transfer flavoprotein beta subunit